ncbi:hypothetical protein [Aeromonas hydrophila]|uniref:hypothetical protein n=1 Tax=Aeromonas hydrophila TaxID=644 RepID=UPI000ACC6A60|nr:hypothetical protein [Aeromonas hydrophila]
MLKEIEDVCSALQGVHDAILSTKISDLTFMEQFGWNCPAVTTEDMAKIALSLKSEISEANIESLPEDMMTYVSGLPRKISIMQSNTIPHLSNTNCSVASVIYISTLNTISVSFREYVCWTSVPNHKVLPTSVLRQLNKIKSQVDDLLPEKDALSKQLKEIQDAHSVAENFPADIQELKKGRDRISRMAEESAVHADKAKTNAQESLEELNRIHTFGERAEKTLNQCEDAYRAAASRGLAMSFESRAKELNVSMRYWVGGLAAALIGGAVLGSNRIKVLSETLSSSPQWGIVAMHIVLSMLSIGAPVWFAWMATKQIGQRFKLMEDYSFKSSVARAYEGYRKEAARIDPAFEARLFSSALSRLEEAPLRFVENESHGSPWHEFFASEPFRNAMSSIPGLKEKFINVAKQEKSLERNPLNQGNTDS